MRVLPGCSREKKNNIKIVCEIFIHMKMKNPKIFKLPQLLKNSSRNSTVSGHSVFQVIHVSSTLSYPHNKKVTLSQTFRYLINSVDPVRLILITFPRFMDFPYATAKLNQDIFGHYSLNIFQNEFSNVCITLFHHSPV